MAQIFHPSTNTISRVSIFGAIFLFGGLLWILNALNGSDYVTGRGEAVAVPFSHKHHKGIGTAAVTPHSTFGPSECRRRKPAWVVTANGPFRTGARKFRKASRSSGYAFRPARSPFRPSIRAQEYCGPCHGR
jgi:hypothetical protein